MNKLPRRAVRSYQAWVANETLEDYALRYAARSFRKWSPFTIANTALGGISFLALEAIGGSLTLNYGIWNVLPAIVVVSIFIFVVSVPIAYYAAAHNIDMDLLTRGAGFGYIGSTITSLTYVMFTFIFFALEGAILAQALNIYAAVPLVVGYAISSLVIIPITVMGVTMISGLQQLSQPIWLVMLIAPFVFVFLKEPGALRSWIGFDLAQYGSARFNYIAFGTCCGLLCSLVVQIGEQVDYLRFMPDRTQGNRFRWWATVISAGPGWILIGGLKILCGSLLVVLAINAGLPRESALQPTYMYIKAYSYVSSNPNVSLLLAVLFVLISQIKINVTNAYAGSLAWSNFFSRVTHYHPGRVVWLIFNILISLTLMLLGIFETLDLVLTVYSNLAIAWIGAIFADLAVLKRLHISPSFLEFKRAHLFNVNPVGCGAMAIASVISITAFTGAFGRIPQAYSAPLSFAVAFLVAILIGILTRGRYYIARTPASFPQTASGTIRCEMCSHSYEHQDMANCTFYERPICSLCCSLDAHCLDACKRPAGKASEPQFSSPGYLLLSRIAPRMGQRVAKVCGVLFAFAVVTGAVFLLAYRLITLHLDPNLVSNGTLLLRIYIATLPLLGVGAWWVVLSHEGRDVAARELVTSLDRLRDAQQELAQSERLAAIGEITATVSHELRNPLGTLVSSVEVLRRSMDPPLPDTRRELDRIERNVWRCARIIEDLLEFSRSRELDRKPIKIDDWVAQNVAEQPGVDEVELRLLLDARATVLVDEERLRQAFANVLQNALQAIEAKEPQARGELTIATRVRGDTIVLEITDNGCGMSSAVVGRIFEPLFSTKAFGVGLGMPLVKRTLEQHGGSVTVESEAGRGTKVTLRLPLRSKRLDTGVA